MNASAASVVPMMSLLRRELTGSSICRSSSSSCMVSTSDGGFMTLNTSLRTPARDCRRGGRWLRGGGGEEHHLHASICYSDIYQESQICTISY